VLEALKNNRAMERIVVLKNAEGSIKKILGAAKDKRIPVQYVERAALDRLSDGGRHQGVIAYVSEYGYAEIEDILKSAAEKEEAPFVVVLDGLEDPHNLGAIMRSGEGAGIHGVIVPERRAAGLTEAVAKASAGAVEYVPVAKVPNITRAIEKLKAAGLWIAALDTGGDIWYSRDLTCGVALVVGGEGKGLGRLVKENCDFVLSLPMNGNLTSLNASAAAAVLMYEARRQRLMAQSPVSC
jgi:23S rRNA (guanosine2251-2'-O)-methyltransferase